MVAVRREGKNEEQSRERDILDLTTGEAVEATPVPYGGEMIVPDDEPWNFPQFDEKRVEEIGQIIQKRAQVKSPGEPQT